MMKEHCMNCHWFQHGHGECRVWGEIPKFVVQEGVCSYFSNINNPSPSLPTKHEQIKSLLMQMKKISDKSIEILAEIAAERMEK